MEAVKKGVWGNWEHMDLNVEFLCSFFFFHSLKQILKNQCIMSRDECQGREKGVFLSAGLQGIPGYKKQCANTNTNDTTTANHSNCPFVIPLHPHSKNTSTEGAWLIHFSDYKKNNGSFFASPLFVFQFPPLDPPMCLPLPPLLAVSWCAGLKFLSQTEMVSFWATRSVCAFYASQLFFALILF